MQRRLCLLGFMALAACHRTDSTAKPIKALRTNDLAPVSVSAPTPAQSFRWPMFFLAEDANNFLWGEGRRIFRLTVSQNGLVSSAQVYSDLTDGLGKLLAAARTQDGTLAVLDVNGRVGVYSIASRRIWEFDTALEGRAGYIAVTEGRVYILLQGVSEGSRAVIAYNFSGAEIGKWSTMPPDGIIQANLKGGGIASCADGGIFYNYINGPQIMQLDQGEAVRVLGSKDESFRVVTEAEVNEAYQKTQFGSVGPLIRLGLGASRVMALRCSDEGLLIRQVARPAGGGSEVQVLDRHAGDWVGSVPIREGILLDVRGRTLYVGISHEGQEFALRRATFQINDSARGGTHK